jgi:hypothetical protein
VLDLRRRGDDFEIGISESAPVSEQLSRAEPPPAPKQPSAAPRLSLRGRGSGRGGRPSALPPELLSIGVVEPHAPTVAEGNGDETPAPKKRAAKKAKAAAPEAAAKKPRKPRAKKAAKSDE